MLFPNSKTHEETGKREKTANRTDIVYSSSLFFCYAIAYKIGTLQLTKKTAR